jgi:type I restriction enzyme R subunit
MLRESITEDDSIDLDYVVLSHYRLSKIRQQDLRIKEDSAEYQLEPNDSLGTAKAKDKNEEFLSQIISRLNELFITDNLTNKDLVNYANTIRDKICENKRVMIQMANNSPEQAMKGDFTKAIEDAIMDSQEAHKEQMLQLLSDPKRHHQFVKVIFDMLQGQNLSR